MNDKLYLHQSRRLAKIVRSLGLNCSWTNYYAWEYRFKNVELNLHYTNCWQDASRFVFVNRDTRELLLKTDSLKEAVRFINQQ